MATLPNTTKFNIFVDIRLSLTSFVPSANLPVRIKRQRSQIQQKFNIFVDIRSPLTSFSLLRTYPFALNGNAPKYNKNSTFLLIFVRLSLRSCLCERGKKTTQIEWVVFCILMVSLVFII